jgi:tetratricopeptide (TPR) repeat protein
MPEAAFPETAPLLPVTAPRAGHWQLWLLLVILTALALGLLAPTLIGLYVGIQERADYMHALAVDHYKQALSYEAENYTALAIAELQIAVKFDPGYQPAVDHLKVLQTTPVPNGTTVPDNVKIADQLFTRAQTAIAGGQWSDAIDSLEEIRRTDATYQTARVEALLVQAYVNGGMQSVSAGQIDQARSRFEAALALDPSNATAQSLRDRAVLYLDGDQAKDSDWAAAVSNFQKLYQQDPAFYDVKTQLLNALVQYGDVATRQGAYCVAAREYEQASQLNTSSDVAARLEQANTSCKLAVTAPTATPTSSAEATTPAGSTPVETPAGVPGAFAASSRIDTSGACQGTGSVVGTVSDAQGSPLSGVRVRIYNDLDYHPSPFATDSGGRYSIVLGINQGLFHLVVLGPDGSPASAVFNVNYPGGLAPGCHWIVDWTKSS